MVWPGPRRHRRRRVTLVPPGDHTEWHGQSAAPRASDRSSDDRHPLHEPRPRSPADRARGDAGEGASSQHELDLPREPPRRRPKSGSVGRCATSIAMRRRGHGYQPIYPWCVTDKRGPSRNSFLPRLTSGTAGASGAWGPRVGPVPGPEAVAPGCKKVSPVLDDPSTRHGTAHGTSCGVYSDGHCQSVALGRADDPQPGCVLSLAGPSDSAPVTPWRATHG